ncbi:MAG: response regulator transcription factor [Bacteroidetes bacterium]|nr:MAG: response regulator transcription factor [Bacteroidota bacterium]
MIRSRNPYRARRQSLLLDSDQIKQSDSGSKLSSRKLEILEHLVDEQTEIHVADDLYISPNTVRTHIKSIYRKLHVNSRASAVQEAFRQHLMKD